MHVDHPEARHVQQVVRQQPAVRGDDAQVQVERAELREPLRILEPHRLHHGNARGLRHDLHRALLHTLPAAPGPVGLRDHGDDLMA